MYDMRDPAQAALAHKLYPELMEERLSIVDQRAELEKSLAKMRIRGYPTREEALILWGAASGAISLPTGTLWDPTSWESAADRAGSIARGVFSPMRLYSANVNKARFPGDILAGAAGHGQNQPMLLGAAQPFGGTLFSGDTGSPSSAQAFLTLASGAGAPNRPFGNAPPT
jgi:hypothetical protein